ncbi:MAG: hypothetical protein IJ735_06365 [Clostridia bacterium]|nr:hypothetical protein [Clostridia bacterium]
MFDWFWEFLYGISKSLLRLIDGLISCANKLCGIETVNIGGTETDLVSYMLRSEAMANGFKVAAVLGFVVLIFFTIARIIMVVLKEKPDMSPIKVAGKAFKSLLLFLFVPAIMLTLVWALNTLMSALYQATMNGSQSLGTFLFHAFSQDAEIVNQSVYDEIIAGKDLYLNTDLVWQAIELSDFDFIFSWISGLALLFTLAGALIQFVDRAISIGVLFMVSPFSIASSVLDDGGRFKLWREQVLLKFISGYGIILYLNIYCLLISLIAPSDVVFFEGTFINNLFKLLIIIGGGFAMQKASALLGNLVGAGAGSREMMDNALGRLGSAAAIGGLRLAGKGLMAGGKKLFGGKKDDKSKDSKEGKSDEAENQNNGNEGEKFDNDPKYNDSKDIGDKIKNGGDNPAENPNGGAESEAGNGGGPREADVNSFNFGKDQANQATRDSITESLRNSTAGGLGSINEADEELGDIDDE